MTVESMTRIGPKPTRRDGPRVLFILEWMPAYRVELFEALRVDLSGRGIELVVVHGDGTAGIERRRDGTDLAGADRRSSRELSVGERTLIWQPWLDYARQADLVIVNEGVRFLLNYWLLARQLAHMGAPVGYWGHGANLDRTNIHRGAEAVKRFVYRLPFWWFPYTEGSLRRVESTGFPAARATVVQNTIFTETLRRRVADLGPSQSSRLKHSLGLGVGPVGLFLGSLYSAKRVPFLIEAADRVHAARPDFSLLIAGDGPDREIVRRMVDKRPYAHLLGRVDGSDKAEALHAATLLMTPGAVGLSALDGFAAGLPTVSTSIPTHGPEFEYLEHGVNAELIPAGATSRDYAVAVLRALDNPRLREGALASGARYSGASMISRFGEGIERALACW